MYNQRSDSARRRDSGAGGEINPVAYGTSVVPPYVSPRSADRLPVVTSRKEETAMNPTVPEQHPSSMGQRTLLVRIGKRSLRSDDRSIGRLQARA
ncbi:hypothetical protein GCM10027167_39080 [Nocardia heshunensis]